MSKNIIRKNFGFTLVELLVVVFLMGIISAIAVPSVSGIMKMVHRKECYSNQKFLRVQLMNYRTGTLDDTPHWKWYAGSYNPATKDWYNVVDKSNNYIYTSYGVDANGKYSFKDIPDQSAGNYFLRCAYKLSGDDSSLEFPHTSVDGCGLYVVWVPLKSDDEINQEFDNKIQKELDALKADLDKKYPKNSPKWQQEYDKGAQEIDEKYNGKKKIDPETGEPVTDEYGNVVYENPRSDGWGYTTIRYDAINEKNVNPKGKVEIYCSCPEHNGGTPLCVYYNN